MERFKNELFSYWLGLVQSDGSFKDYRNKKLKRVSIGFVSKDKILVERFNFVCFNVFHRKLNVGYNKSKNIWLCDIGVKKLLPIFESLGMDFSDPPKPPIWIIDNSMLFGSYLAGVIDGYGNIRIKRKKYPQCAIRIISGSKQKELLESIRKNMNCSVNIDKNHRKAYYKKENRFIEGSYYVLEFLVSSKNIDFVKEFILPKILLERKSKKLSEYIKMRGWAHC